MKKLLILATLLASPVYAQDLTPDPQPQDLTQFNAAVSATCTPLFHPDSPQCFRDRLLLDTIESSIEAQNRARVLFAHQWAVQRVKQLMDDTYLQMRAGGLARAIASNQWDESLEVANYLNTEYAAWVGSGMAPNGANWFDPAVVDAGGVIGVSVVGTIASNDWEIVITLPAYQGLPQAEIPLFVRSQVEQQEGVVMGNMALAARVLSDHVRGLAHSVQTGALTLGQASDSFDDSNEAIIALRNELGTNYVDVGGPQAGPAFDQIQNDTDGSVGVVLSGSIASRDLVIQIVMPGYGVLFGKDSLDPSQGFNVNPTITLTLAEMVPGWTP